jgi:tellurite resistance protein
MTSSVAYSLTGPARLGNGQKASDLIVVMVAGQAAQDSSRPRAWRVPPNLFSMAFGLAGLADAWRAAEPVLGVPAAVPDALYALALVVWVATLAAYLAQGPRQLVADVLDPVLAPFICLIALTPMILATTLVNSAFTAGRVITLVFLAATVGYGGWLIGHWIAGDIPQDKSHPGYFLPTIAGGFIAAEAAATFGLRGLAEATFGIGLISWFLIGSTILNRLFFSRPLPAPLVPTLAIEVAPPAVGGIAYFAITGGSRNFLAAALGGYAVLMALAQLRLFPQYRRLTFGPTFWAFAFSYAAVATYALEWISLTRVPAGAFWSVVVLILITGFIGTIAVRTAVLAARGQLLPAPGPPAAIKMDK